MRQEVMWSFIAIFLCSAVVLAQATGEDGAESKDVFGDVVEVTSTTIKVTVLDDEDRPRRGLPGDAFSVFEDGQEMEISSVIEIGGDGQKIAENPGHLVILIDNTNLRKRSRKKVLDDLAVLADTATKARRPVMLATLGGTVETFQEFTSDLATLKRSLEMIEDTEAVGEQWASSKRVLIREIRAVDLHRDMRPSISGSMSSGLSSGQEYIVVQGQQYLHRIQDKRQRDLQRWQYSLFWVDHTVRILGGIKGQKDLVWVTEDIQVSPMLDVYRAFHAKFSQWERELGLEHPEVWARSVSLSDSFSQLSMIANAAGTSLHVVDISNLDRRSADMAMEVSDVAMFTTGTPSGERTSTGDDLAASGTAAGSARAMAESTGGSFFGGSRDYEEMVRRLSGQLNSYYEISYQKPGLPDGQLHPVEVKVAGGDFDLVHPRLMGRRTALQELADRTLTRLHLGIGDDTLETRLRFGGTEPSEEEKVIRTVHVEVATAGLGFERQDDTMVGSLVLLFQSMGANGIALPPQVLQQPVSVPAARLSDSSRVRASARLKIAKNARRLAVGVLDQLSGSEGTAVAEISSGN